MDNNYYKADQPDCCEKSSRRKFMATATASAIGGLCGVNAGAALAARSLGSVPLTGARAGTEAQGRLASREKSESRRLHIVNEHLGEELDLVYYIGGVYRHAELSRLNWLMRDRRAGLDFQMDTTLYDQLFLLREELRTDTPVHVLSGYRTAATNAKLRSRSKGVAKYSLHMEGRAADIYVPGVSTNDVRRAAVSMKAGGVGVYSHLNFVHIDTGTVRYWGK